MAAGRSPTVRRRRLAAELRALRHEAGRTMTETAAGTNLSQPAVSRIERAETTARPNDVRALATFLGASRAKVEELVTLASQLRRRGWWHAYGDALAARYSNYIEIEEAAVTEYTYQPSVLPGLLQTVDYARAVSAAVLGEHAPVADLAAVRQRRQELLGRPEKPLRLHAILDETALHRRYGDDQIMRAQFRHLRDSVQRSNITIQVVPTSAHGHPVTTGPFVLLEFTPPEPPVVYQEGTRNDVYLEDDADIDWFKMIFGRLEDLALSPEDSISLVADRIDA